MVLRCFKGLLWNSGASRVVGDGAQERVMLEGKRHKNEIEFTYRFPAVYCVAEPLEAGSRP